MNNTDKHEKYLTQAFKSACMVELEALKPGNVHIFSDGHGMQVQDFMHSAEAAANVIAKPELTVGQRILQAIKTTEQVVGCNTNLGIVLLCAPLIRAAFLDASIPFKTRIDTVLKQLTLQDAVDTFEAIRIAAPAGLGESQRHDVHQPPQGTLLDAMLEASDKDYIARQYANGYQEVCLGLEHYQALLQRWQRPAWVTTGLYLHFLASYPDSHIIRKYGAETAEDVRSQAIQHQQAFLNCENPKTYMAELLKWDAVLKAKAINPGTSADMTVAALLLFELLGKAEINSSEVS